MEHTRRVFTFKACRLPPPTPPVNLRVWTEVKIEVFWNMDMLHIKLKKIAHASNMVANASPKIPPDTGGGVNRSKVYFFQHGHVAYQIKGNDKCSNLQANILSLHSEISII